MIWYGKILFCRTSLKSGTATAVPAVLAAAPMMLTLRRVTAILVSRVSLESTLPVPYPNPNPNVT